MCYLSNICFICLKDIDILQSVYLNKTEDAVKQIKYVLPEITLEPEIPVRICSTCDTKLHSFCAFKKQCLENYCRFTDKLRELGNTKDQSFNAFPIETMFIKEENHVDDDLINETPEELNTKINCVKKDTIRAVQDETISPGLKRNINEVSCMTDDIKNFKCEEQHDQTNSVVEDICIKEDIIKFEDNKEPNLCEELLSDIKKEIDSEQDINEIESADLNINNSERSVSNLIISSDSVSYFMPFECKICNKKFIKRSELIKHNKKHTGVKDYQCTICEKKFTQQGSLNVHFKTHTGVKNFQCYICEKKFIRNNEMKLHIQTHTGEKDFQCTMCEKKFTQKWSLAVHIKAHNGIKDFHCSVCEKKFLHKRNLNIHMKTHDGVKDFQCNICDKKFTRNDRLKMHMKTHTGVNASIYDK